MPNRGNEELKKLLRQLLQLKPMYAPLEQSGLDSSVANLIKALWSLLATNTGHDTLVMKSFFLLLRYNNMME